MTAAEKDAIIQKELKVVEVYLTNLQNTSSWRLPTLAALARDSRGSLRKVTSLIGYTGQWWRDIWLYVAACLPLAIPINLAFGTTIFAAIVAFITTTLSVVAMEPRTIEKSFEKTVEVPFLFFFTRTKTISGTISETVMVPVVHAPDVAISRALAVLIILVVLLSASWLLKRLWIREIDFRRRRLQHIWDATFSRATS